MQEKFVRLLPLLAATAFSASTHAAQVLTNGGFETGNFSGWVASTNGVGGCDTDWNVGTTGAATGCAPVPNPFAGTYAAYNSFDGNGPQEFRLRQSVTLPSSIQSASLSWTQAYDVSVGGAARTFEVLITNAADTAVLATINTQSFSGDASAGWTTFNANLGAALTPLAGQTVNLVFRNFIPENFTGPAGFGLDNVALDVTAQPASIPTLSEWGLIVLSSVMALMTVFTLRRQRR